MEHFGGRANLTLAAKISVRQYTPVGLDDFPDQGYRLDEDFQ